ncbi:MAG: ABC transporter substrate-binding protein [Thermodesulfobacteriota bacterium]
MSNTAKYLSILTILGFLLSPSIVQATEATTQLKATIFSVLSIIKDPMLKGEKKAPERRKKVKRAIKLRFSYEEMAKRSLGKHWRKRSDAEKKEFTELFTEIIETAYINKLESLGDDTVVFNSETVKKNSAKVNTRIVTQMGTELPVSYKLVKKDSTDWKVYDIVVSGISMVNNYRNKFGKQLMRNSFEELIAKLKEENKEKAEDA